MDKNEDKTLKNDEIKLRVISLLEEGYNITEISFKLDIPRKTISSFLNAITHKKWWQSVGEKKIADGKIHDHHKNIKLFNGTKRFILTSAQNNTFIHEDFYQSLLNASNFYNAKLIIGTYTYNKNGFQSLVKDDGEWYDSRIKKYILNDPAQLADELVWCGELNILPTAVNPMSGLQNYTKSSSAIIPHAKMQMESIPSKLNELPKFLYTTGSITKRNYIQKKSGQKASFYHVFGALLVEIDDDGDWFVRQLVAENETGSFYDLNNLFTPEGTYQDLSTVEAINWGDIHSEKRDESCFKNSFEKKNTSILDILKPKYQFVHDVLDFESRNHHNIKDPYEMFRLYSLGKDCVENNLKTVISTLKSMERKFSDIIVVSSNHDLALQKWLKNSDYRSDPVNALLFLELQFEAYKSLKDNKYFSPLEYYIRNKSDIKNIKFLKTDESFIICGKNGIECGQHGHNGVNGSKGTIDSFKKFGLRINLGHSHSAGIKDGVFQAGVSGLLDMNYNEGPSTWSHSHIITYKNEKRTIITMKNGKWKK